MKNFIRKKNIIRIGTIVVIIFVGICLYLGSLQFINNLPTAGRVTYYEKIDKIIRFGNSNENIMINLKRDSWMKTLFSGEKN